MTHTDLPIYERLPASAVQALPRVALGTFPTPVERFTIDTPSGERDILVKRDDLCADGYGGNKARKMEFLLADAATQGARRLITAGAAGSHHAFATAFHGIAHGFDVSLVLFPQTRTEHVRTMLRLDHAVGAELRWASRMETVPYNLWRARMAHRADRPVTIPPGGSNQVGTIGYVNAALEFAAQLESGEAEPPSAIHVAAGTLGTVAGLAIGLAWANLDIPIIATRITPSLVTNERVLASLVKATIDRLRIVQQHPGNEGMLPSADAALRLVDLRHDQFGDGYGRTTAASIDATRVFADAGLQLDPTYTSKSAASLILDLASDRGGRPPLFWHTLSATEPLDLVERQQRLPMPPQFERYLNTPPHEGTS